MDKESTLKSQLNKKEKLVEELQEKVEELRKENKVNQIEWFRYSCMHILITLTK